MIPVADIIAKNLYSQDDASFLLGIGFTEDAAREAISEACRSGDLAARKWRGRWWFTGAEFLGWVARWFGEQVGVVNNDDSDLAHPAPLRHNDLCRSGARSPSREGR